jgi:hypothetical protein
MPRLNVNLQHYMIRMLFFIISKLDHILNTNTIFCNLWQFIISWNMVPNYRLLKHEKIVWFSTSPKEPWTSLKWHKCLDNGQMHARTCAHKNMFTYLVTKVPFYLCWWNHYYGLPKVDFCSSVCGWRLEAHIYFANIGTNVVWCYCKWPN